MSLLNAIIPNTDSYKASHFLQYPKGTEYVSSYIETRGADKNSWIPDTKEVVHFGLQMFIQKYLTRRISLQEINETEELFALHGIPFYRQGWIDILRRHNGQLPIRIEAVPEGTVLPLHNVQVQIVNTDPAAWWLTSYLETALVRAVWYPSTVATLSREAKKTIYQNLIETSDDPDAQIPFKLHDFGARGVSSQESAMIGGTAHLVNFMGTDTIAGLLGARKYYGADMAGFSIPASEHSTITAWGEENEVDAYRNMITQFAGPEKLVAVVSDSYDIYRAADQLWGVELKDEVEASGGTVVVRPDSGDPLIVTANVIRILGERFGFDVNSKGYKVLKPCIRMIQGDGVNPKSIKAILDNFKSLGWSADNIAFGMGGGLLQKLDRDTLKFAMKANAIRVNGEWRDIWKKPATDSGKDSKAGQLALILNGNCEYETIRKEDYDSHVGDENFLVPVFNTGTIMNTWTFDEVRANAALS
jgi:nicotinamide phosphoribosyltransferase